MSQLTYQNAPNAAIEGALTRGDAEIISRVANGAVKPGKYVVLGTNNDCAHPTAEPTALTRGGIALRQPYKQNDGNYADGEMVDVLVRGFVGVDPETAVTENTAAYVRCTAAGAEQLGALRADADGEVDAVLGLTETDANVEDGTFVVILEDSDGIQYECSFTSSTTTHANAAAGIAAAIAAKGPFSASAGAEVSDKIQITISHSTTNKSLRIKHVESVGASALSIDTQGSADAFAIPGLVFRQSAATGVIELEVRPAP